MFVGAFLDVTFRTADPPAAESVRRIIGTADAYLEVAYCPRVDGIYYEGRLPYPSNGCDVERTTSVDLTTLLPPGSTGIQNARHTAQARLAHGEQSLRMSLLELEMTSPLADGLLRLRSGRSVQAVNEVVLTTEAAQALGAVPGDRLTSSRFRPVTLVGTVVEPGCLTCEAAYGLPGWTGRSGKEPDPAARATGAFLVDLPEGTDPFVLQRDLLDDGVVLTPRAEMLDPPPSPHRSGLEGGGIAILALVVGFGLIEVCLLAGTAFAVGARRQVRDLGLVAAAGGEARHIRRIVLAQGVVTGVVGSVAALPLVVAVVVLARPWLERVNGALMGPLDVRPLEVLPLVGVGVLAGLAAALVPAFTTARLPVLDALNRRFRATSLAARWPRIGVALFVLGGGLAALGSWLWLRSNQGYRDRLEQLASQSAEAAEGTVAGFGGANIPPPPDAQYIAMLLFSFAIAALGLALLAPTLVATIARAARRLPLSARMGLRDAGRHRHRTGPAVAAIMGAVAGSVAVAFYTLGDSDFSRRS